MGVQARVVPPARGTVMGPGVKMLAPAAVAPKATAARVEDTHQTAWKVVKQEVTPSRVQYQTVNGHRGPWARKGSRRAPRDVRLPSAAVVVIQNPRHNRSCDRQDVAALILGGR